MIMDNFYTNYSKGHFYLGMISKVQIGTCVVQVENLSLYSTRMIGFENIMPSSVNFMVAIESTNGIFVGTVYQNAIKNSDSVHQELNNRNDISIYPELIVDIQAVYSKSLNTFTMLGYLNPGITDKVYVASSEIIKKYIESLDIQNTKSPTLPIFSTLVSNNLEIRFNSDTLFNRHLMIIGSTGGGKSTSSLSLLEALLKSNKKFVIVDATGEYRDSFFDNEVEKLDLGINTFITPGSLTISQWISFLEASPGIQAPSLMKAINSLKFQKKNGSDSEYRKIGSSIAKINLDMSTLNESDKEFNISLLAKQLVEESVQESARNRGFYEENAFNLNANQILIDRLNYKLKQDTFKNFFSSCNQDSLLDRIEKFMSDDTRILINASSIDTRDSTGGMIIDLITQTMLNKKVAHPKSFVFFVDEVHRFTKTANLDGENYFNGLISIAREGRKKGQYLLLTTQSPQDVSKILLGQIGTLLIHRITHIEDLNSISSYLREGDSNRIKKLRNGEAIITSVNLLHTIQMNIIKSNRKHYSGSPEL